MNPRCRVCGQFISEHELFNTDEIECCKEHGFIQTCGPCLEMWEKYCKPQHRGTCVTDMTRLIWRTLRINKPDVSKYACPNCDYVSYSFEAASKHMFAKNHLYEGVGTYPIYVAPTIDSASLRRASQ